MFSILITMDKIDNLILLIIVVGVIAFLWMAFLFRVFVFLFFKAKGEHITEVMVNLIGMRRKSNGTKKKTESVNAEGEC